MHDEEDLPRQRTPSLGLGAAAYLNQPMAVENPMGRPPGISSPQSAPPNISLLPPTPHNELSEESVALLTQKPPAPMSAPSIPTAVTSANLQHAHSHCHRPTPQERYTKTSQASTRDTSLQHLQMQVPSGIRCVNLVGRKSPVPDRPVGQTDTIDGEQLPPLVPIQLPNSTTTPHGYINDHHDAQYNLEPKILQPNIQPPHFAVRPPAPAFLPRQGSAPPRFGGSRPPSSFSNGGGERDRPRSTSASSGPPVQPMRQVSTGTDPGIRPSRSRSTTADAPTNSYASFKPISSDASIPSTSTLRQQNLKAMSDPYNDRASRDTESADKTSGKGKNSKFPKSEQDKSDEVINVLRRSNAYAAEKPSSPQRQFNTKPPRPEVGLVPQPFGTPRSPPVSSNTLEEAQVIKHNNRT